VRTKQKSNFKKFEYKGNRWKFIAAKISDDFTIYLLIHGWFNDSDF